MRKERLATGIVGSAHGLDGSVKVRSYSGTYDHLSAEQTLEARRGAVSRTLSIERVRPVRGSAVVKFREISDRNQAESLNGFELWVARSQATALSDEEYYVADLVGMEVIAEGTVVGKVAAIVDGAQSDLLEIQ